jgi:hypothetical protein
MACWRASGGFEKSCPASGCSVQNGQEMDKSPVSPMRYLAKLLSGLVELTGIEPVTS